jgi:hypothetical protein
MVQKFGGFVEIDDDTFESWDEMAMMARTMLVESLWRLIDDVRAKKRCDWWWEMKLKGRTMATYTSVTLDVKPSGSVFLD